MSVPSVFLKVVLPAWLVMALPDKNWDLLPAQIMDLI
jgi:hypothetical protein